MRKCIIILFVIISANNLLAQEDEAYFGEYKSYNSKFTISFKYNLKGIKDLKIGNFSIADSVIIYDTLGKYEGDLFFRITYKERDSSNHMKILFVTDGNNVIMAVGYYIKFIGDGEGKLKILKKTPFMLKMTKKYSYEDYEK
jgi:hypothetical protein